MYIEIRKGGFINKGAELMVYAVLKQLSSRAKNASLVMAPGGRDNDRPYRKRACLGLYQKASFSVFGLQIGDVATLVPKRLRDMYGVVLEREIDVVLDIAGYSYNDNAGAKALRELARSSRRWKKNSTKVILLPQAFGPFSSSYSQKLVREIVTNVTLIYARDEISLDHLVSAVGVTDKIKIAPDFTNLVPGIPPNSVNRNKCRICLIPNYRMIDRTEPEVSSRYVEFMQRIMEELLDNDVALFFLLHEGSDDLAICEELCSSIGKLPIIIEDDPLRIKGIIGACDGVVGSRYHGLVSALSQGIPALATGWSHKYEALFRDYRFEAGILPTDVSDAEMKKAVNLLVSKEKRDSVSSKLLKSSERIRLDSNVMWDNVFTIIDG